MEKSVHEPVFHEHTDYGLEKLTKPFKKNKPETIFVKENLINGNQVERNQTALTFWSVCMKGM